MSQTRIVISDGTADPSQAFNQILIDCMNVPQGRDENKAYLDTLGEGNVRGVDRLVQMAGLNVEIGLTQIGRAHV